MSRPETGPMQFGDDWPGVFVRGDDAKYFNMTLDLLKKLIAVGDIGACRGIVKLMLWNLPDSDINTIDPATIQKMKPWDECKEQP